MNPLCECAGAGFCTRHQMNKSDTLYKLCSGQGNCSDCGYKYWVAWERGKLGATKPDNPKVNPPEFCSPLGPTTGTVPCAGCNSKARVSNSSTNPSLIKIASNASHALARFIGDGCKTTTPSEEAERLAICESCPLNNNGQCTGCGCIIKLKVQSRLEKCPASKWHPDLHQVRPLVEPIKNLIMHVMPVDKNDNWKWNMREVLKRQDLFNGKKVLAISIENNQVVAGKTLRTVSADEVINYCNCIGLKWDTIEAFPNNSVLREVVTFPWLLESVKSDNPNEITFSCHAKGVTHSAESITLKWAEKQYHVCLDNWASVKNALERYSIAGSIRRFGEFKTPGNHRWHYSGTFYWFRHDDVFNSTRDWRKIDQEFFGTESWPGLMFKPEEAACLFADNAGDPYGESYWATLQEEIRIWEEARREA